jgi:hypothetical protein
VTSPAIPGLNQASELGEAVFPPEMIISYIKAEHKTQKHINKIEAH